jgi:hypothetical protein
METKIGKNQINHMILERCPVCGCSHRDSNAPHSLYLNEPPYPKEGLCQRCAKEKAPEKLAEVEALNLMQYIRESVSSLGAAVKTLAGPEIVLELARRRDTMMKARESAAELLNTLKGEEKTLTRDFRERIEPPLKTFLAEVKGLVRRVVIEGIEYELLPDGELRCEMDGWQDEFPF